MREKLIVFISLLKVKFQNGRIILYNAYKQADKYENKKYELLLVIKKQFIRI